MPTKKRTMTGQTQLNDLTGQRFGLLVVEERAPNDKFGTVYWYLRCECGERVIRRANTLRAGKFFTCGAAACRFWEKVHIPEGEGCWEWSGALKDTGYGVFKNPSEKANLLAHVFSWELHNKKAVPEGSMVRHTCDNRKCVRPDHLVLGTHRDNMKDMVERGRSSSPRPHMPEEVKAAVLRDVKEGVLTHTQIAAKYGTTTRTISRWLHGS